MNTETRNTNVAITEEVMESLAQKLFHDVVVKAVIKKMVTAIPFLGHPLLNPFTVYIVTLLATKLYDHMKLVGGLWMIKFKKEQERKEYDQAVLDLKKALTSGRDIQKAKDEFKKRLYDLVRINVDRVR